MNFIIPDIQLTADQQSVMSAGPDIIIKGPAGTGKTLLCILKAEQLCKEGNNVAIIISTKALKRFIQSALSFRQLTNCVVFHQFEWFTKAEDTYDFILIDEAQDFSLNLILRIRTCAHRGLYILGDSRQQIFETTFYNNEPTISLEEIAKHLDFNVIEMKKSVRVPKSIANFVSAWGDSIEIAESVNDGVCKPLFVQCNSYIEQLEMLVRLISEKEENASIGILLETNDIKLNNESQEIRPGIMEIYSFLTQKKVSNLGYKYEQSDNLEFSKHGSVNILTFHSAKGLEFNHVIIPFFDNNYNHRGAGNINYVGFTRTSARLTLLYTNKVTVNFPIIKDRSVYDGKLQYPDYTMHALSFIEQYNKSVQQYQAYIDQGLCTKQEANDVLCRLKCPPYITTYLEMSGYNEQEISEFLNEKINSVK
jgi:superfamily I DNA/RNA helicase